MEIPLSTLLELIFSDNEEINSRPLMCEWVGPDLRPVKIDLALGHLLQAIDPEEELVHIDLCQKHAQVWRKSAWMDSNEHRWRLKKNSQEWNLAYDKRRDTIEELAQKLADATGMPVTHCMAKATKIYDKHEVVIAEILGIALS